MELVKNIEKRVQMNLFDIVKYQISTYCYLKNIRLSPSALICLTHLSLAGEIEQSIFCNNMASLEVFTGAQVVRNLIRDSVTEKIVLKNDKTKVIQLNPELQVYNKGTILLDFKFFYRDTNQN